MKTTAAVVVALIAVCGIYAFMRPSAARLSAGMETSTDTALAEMQRADRKSVV